LFLNEYKIYHPLVNEIPYLPVLGNHEHANDSLYGRPNYNAIFSYPGFYTQQFDDAVLIITDSNLILDQYQDMSDSLQDNFFKEWYVSDSNSEESSWLERQLADSDKQFKIVVMHHPPISFAKHHNDWYNSDYGNDLLEKRRLLLDLLSKYNVQVVFSGHDHMYQHNLLDTDSGHQIHFLVGGGAGGSLRNLADSETMTEYQNQFAHNSLKVTSVKLEKLYHYFLIDVNQANLNIKVIEVNEKIENHTQLVEEIVIN